jgi:hypothetical protein
VTKTDDILLELNRTFANYFEGVGQFKHEGKTYRTANYFVPSHYMKCDICGNFPRISIFIIKSDVDKLRVGNECIDRITNQNVSYGSKTIDENARTPLETEDTLTVSLQY